MENNPFIPESEEFGMPDAWRLVSRTVVDGLRTTIRVMSIEGRGMLMQTARQQGKLVAGVDGDGWGPMVYDELVLLENVMLMEMLQKEVSQISDASGKPADVKYQCLHRQLLGVNVARERFMPKGKKNAKGQGNLNIRAGTIVTQERVQQPAVVPVSAPIVRPGA